MPERWASLRWLETLLFLVGSALVAARFEPRAVARLVAEHQAGARDHGKLLWSLVVFEQWRAHHPGAGRLV
jgi:hypothetical protein